MNTGHKRARSAIIKQVLVYYDGPQLIVLRSSRGHPMLAIAVAKAGMKYPLFACEVIGNVVDRYLMGKVDLSYVFRATPIGRLFFFDLDSVQDDRVDLIPALSTEARDERFYPGPGIFSRCHTYQFENEEEDTSHEFLIDGIWDAQDFSRFYGKIADTYSLTFVVNRLSEGAATPEDKAFLRSSISERNWQGGGSYLSFYRGVKERASSRYPLRVAGIEYHSPGFIKLAGNSTVLDQVVSIIYGFISKTDHIETYYKSIYDVLKKDGLLRAEKMEQFSSDAYEDIVNNNTRSLLNAINLPNTQELYAACDNNTLIFAKVALSCCRRVRDLARFYIEGRVRSAQIPASASMPAASAPVPNILSF